MTAAEALSGPSPWAQGARRTAVVLALLGFALALAVPWSISVGAVPVSLSVMVNTLFGLEGPHQDFIILNLRLPRTVLAVATGGALALSGAIVQALLRNALASPGVIGVSSGAALAVCLSVVLGASVTLLPLFAVLGGFLAASVVYVASLGRRASPVRLALVGIAVGFLCNSGVDFLLVTAPRAMFSAPIIWLTGSLWGREWTEVALTVPALIPLSVLALAVSYRLDLLRLGDAQARGLGVAVGWERPLLLVLATALAAVSVSAVGALGFVGLMAPHIARQLVGGDHRALMPVAMLAGMLLVVLADAAGRAVAPPLEISAGIVTALLGAPFFVFLLFTGQEARGQ
jgi:iron complex transport system permease protein